MTGERPPAPEGARQPDLDVETLLAALDASPDPRAREVALDLLEAVMGLHRAGFSRILEMVRNHPAGEDFLRTMREDPVVASLLLSHDLLDSGAGLEARVRAALEKVRPYMHGHGGDVEVVEVRAGRVRLRLTGACDGCGFSENTLRLGIEQILRKEVPEVEEIVVSGPFARPEVPGGRGARTPDAPGAAAAVTAAGQGWRRMASLDEMPEGTLRTVALDRGAVLLCAAYGRVYAFRDACPEGGRSMAGGTLIAFILKCPCHGFAFDVRSGRSLSGRELALEPLPSAWEDGQLRVAV
jgi:Fe-S cluster biogenesis protein NfuA/nitrite reductase/ring-hydroxylating ferredoxin subunit